MQLKRTVILILALSSMVAAGCRGWTTDNPPIHLNPNMDTQEKHKAFRESSFFKDGRSMRPYVEGTVPRSLAGNESYDKNVLAGVTPEFTGKENGEWLLDLPAGYDANDKAFVAQGKKDFGVFCAPCHGKAADGKSPIARRFPVPPPSFKQDRLYGMPLGQIYAAITHGKNAPNMPSYATQIPDVKARWGVVTYLRKTMMKEDPKTVVAFKVDPSINAVVVAAGADPKIGKGAALYTAKGCNACHSTDGSRVVGPTFAGIYGRAVKGSGGERTSDDAYITESILEPAKFVVDGYPPAMPPQNLTSEEISQLIAWMKTLKK